jgi:multicomponent Na+:H+ antiporter subunit E
VTRRWPVAGLLFGVVWVLVRGVEPAPAAVAARLLSGVAVGLPVAFVFRRMYRERVDVPAVARSLPYVVGYLWSFLREVVVANVDVAYRVLAPGMPIEPEVMYVPLRVETDVGVTTIANSITLTPGTLTLDHDPEENALYVHVIDGRNPRQVVAPIRRWEDYALQVFDEDRSPDDPAPPVRMTPDDAPPDPRTPALPRGLLGPDREASGRGEDGGTGRRADADGDADGGADGGR